MAPLVCFSLCVSYSFSIAHVTLPKRAHRLLHFSFHSNAPVPCVCFGAVSSCCLAVGHRYFHLGAGGERYLVKVEFGDVDSEAWHVYPSDECSEDTLFSSTPACEGVTLLHRKLVRRKRERKKGGCRVWKGLCLSERCSAPRLLFFFLFE